MRRIGAVLCVVAAFAGSAAFAVAQNTRTDVEKLPAGPEVILQGAPKAPEQAFKEVIKIDRANAKPGTEKGPVIGADEIHIPDEPVE